MAVTPLSDKILVKRLEAEDKTKGGIILPDSAKEKPREGKVEAVGPGRVMENGERSKMQIKPGDRVIFAAYGSTEIKIDGVEFLVMSEDDVLAIVQSK